MQTSVYNMTVLNRKLLLFIWNLLYISDEVERALDFQFSHTGLGVKKTML